METGNHLEHEQIARLAEGSLAAEDASSVRNHLAACRSCFAAYVDAVRYRAAWLADADGFRMRGAERRVALSRFIAKRTGPRRAMIWSARALGFAALSIAVIVTLRSFRQAPMRPAPFALDPVVSEALSRTSAKGLMLPGALPPAAGGELELRSGPSTSSSAIERPLRAALETYERNGGDADACVRLVAALLANGEVLTANDYARECLHTHPDAMPLLVFAAEAKLRSNDVSGAEALMVRATRLAPNDMLATLDLGLVCRQAGAREKARTAFERASRSGTRSIAERAKRELSLGF